MVAADANLGGLIRTTLADKGVNVTFHKSQAMGNRLSQIEDIAPLVVFLAGDGHWVTGQTIFANGGYTTR